MDIPTLVVALLATWSITQLATRDEITARPRRALRRLVSRHRPATRPSGKASGYECTCGWDATRVVAGTSDLKAHIAYQRSREFWYRLITCPWCVSLEIAAVVGWSALAWGDGWGWWAVAVPLGARVLAGAAVVHLGPDDDDTDDD